MFPVALRIVGSLIHILFLIRRACMGFVHLEVANEVPMGTDRASNNTHDILGEYPSLVGTDDGGVGHVSGRTSVVT